MATIDITERHTVSGTGDASGLILTLVHDAGGTGSATGTYRGHDLDASVTLADGAPHSWLMRPAD